MNNLIKLEEFLLDFDLISITGNLDRFLQGQISINMQTLAVDEHSFCCFCEAKGKVIVSGWILRKSQTQVWLLFAKGGYDLLIGLLAKFLPFYKDIEIKNFTNDYNIFALDKNKIPQNYQDKLQNITQAKEDIFSEINETSYMNISFIKQTLVLICAKKSCQEIIEKNFQKHFFLTKITWNYKLAKSGLVLVDKNLSNKYIPQMLNYHLYNGISLNKGCYTGQEVIARLEFRGKIRTNVSLFETNEVEILAEVAINDKIMYEGGELGELIFIAKESKSVLLVCFLKQSVLDGGTLSIKNFKLEKKVELDF